jgi:hypothetical protein
MNQRIKELMLKSNPDGDFSDCEWVFERFAELIVQECVNVLHDNELWNRHISHVLKEHFGVEE